MINFLKSYTHGGYKVYCNWKVRGWVEAYEDKFRVYRFLEDGSECYMGIMTMAEARNMFSALYL